RRPRAHPSVHPSVVLTEIHPRVERGDLIGVAVEGERRIGNFRRIPTLPFNGYADQVASLYAGMDLRKNY
ncbi:MAG: hypothetical protein ACKOH8_06445, partial [Gemmatimonadota bacterium]